MRRLKIGPSDQLLTNSGIRHSLWALSSENFRTRKPRPRKHFHHKAGDRIRADDVPAWEFGSRRAIACGAGTYNAFFG